MTHPAVAPSEVRHHGLPASEVVVLLGTDPADGLRSDEAQARLQRFGPNVLPRLQRAGPLRRFARQLNHPLIYVLLVSAALTGLLGDGVASAVILGVVVINAIVGYVQESRANSALDALRAMTPTTTSLVRDGTVVQLNSERVVPGDLVVLTAGDKVPADLRLVQVEQLEVDESALTGESLTVAKHALALPIETALADRLNMAYSGTLITRGTGRGVVVTTGAETELGRIHRLVGESEPVPTPLARKLATFSKWLTVAIVILGAFAFGVGVWRGEPIVDMVTAGVALAVGAIPEGLPAAVTITLAIGVSRMARRNAIVRSLTAAETLGGTTVICTDKTGTLTHNRMSVRNIWVDGAEVSTPVLQASGVTARLLHAAALCSDAPVPRVGVDPVGDPTEVALVLAAEESGLDVHALRAAAPRTDTLPFESGRRLMATVHDTPSGSVLFVKGALEDVLRTCNRVGTSGGDAPLDEAAVHAAADSMAARALRVLAVAEVETEPGTSAEEALAAQQCRLLGLQAMADPPRQDAIAAVASCHRAGIDVKMVTGDHVLTATAVAAQVGLEAKPGAAKAVTGAQLGDAAVLPIETIDSASVFARVTAEQKLRIVESLQRAGSVVAVTGDGVNDAPALRQADIGVAMGRSGTDAATEAADMVLTDDDFATIEAAVEEGRGVRDNVTKFITWTLPTNLAEGLVILTAILVGSTLPILPVQILWINMTTAVALGLMLAFEPKEAGIMDRPPRDPDEPILTRALVWRVILVSVLTLAAAFGFFEYALSAGASVEVARTIAVNTFVAIEIAYLFNCRSLDRPLRQLRFFSNPAALYGVAITIALQALFTYTAPFQQLFETAAIGPMAWLAIGAAAIVSYLVVSVDKWAARRSRRS